VDYRLKIAAQAKRDFAEIWREIAYDGREIAQGFCEELAAKARSVTMFPYRHGQFAQRPNFRKLPYKSYIIFYKIDDANRTVTILRYWHAARDQRRLRLREAQPQVYGGPVEAPASI
jgi:plasmid stabilization system protein ParE